MYLYTYKGAIGISFTATPFLPSFQVVTGRSWAKVLAEDETDASDWQHETVLGRPHKSRRTGPNGARGPATKVPFSGRSHE